MIFAHIFDDYYMQGILASMKQKSWWQANASDAMYRFDYVAALLAHSFSWAFMIMLPIVFAYEFGIATHVYCIALFANMFIHAIVDDLKANKKKINLIVDQSIHILQIVVTWLYFI
jgi:hypothetical protein